jgi:hypothetical protein
MGGVVVVVVFLLFQVLGVLRQVVSRQQWWGSLRLFPRARRHQEYCGQPHDKEHLVRKATDGSWVGIFCGRSSCCHTNFSVRQIFNQSGNRYMTLPPVLLNKRGGIADLGFGGRRRRRIQIGLSFCI